MKARYETVDNLNRAWATQRWSRHLNSFDEVQLPYADGPAPPERYLDLRRRSAVASLRPDDSEDYCRVSVTK